MTLLHSTRPTPTRPRRGVTLLVVLGVAVVTSLLVVGILQTATLRLSAVRNTADYERALYLAGAAVHHALAELEQDPTWRDGVPATQLPAGSGNTYSATAVDGTGGTVVVTGAGTAGGVTRKLEVTVQTSG